MVSGTGGGRLPRRHMDSRRRQKEKELLVRAYFLGSVSRGVCFFDKKKTRIVEVVSLGAL